MMKKYTIFLAMLSAAIAGQALAQQSNIEEWARVKSSEPIYGQAVAIQRPSCTTQMVQRNVMPAPVYQQQPQQQQQDINYGGAIIGSILGGVLGNQVGGGRGKALATAAGAGIGALTGERMIGGNSNSNNSNNNSNSNSNYNYSNAPQAPLYGQTQMVPVENCVTITEMQPAPIVGYRVVLDFHGRDFLYQTPVAPRKEYVKVRVQVAPEF